tara:strand:+ start:2118 stop:2447 length:330 start_codon:yes stop_codon:yes gene_type:complete
MGLDHEAIYKAYPSVSRINDSTGAFDSSGNTVSLDDSLVKAARTALDAEAAATLYQRQRTGQARTTDTIYPSIGDQLDNLYKDIVAGTLTTSGAFATAIKAVKDKYPKP